MVVRQVGSFEHRRFQFPTLSRVTSFGRFATLTEVRVKDCIHGMSVRDIDQARVADFGRERDNYPSR